jgi:hypothetical protein
MLGGALCRTALLIGCRAEDHYETIKVELPMVSRRLIYVEHGFIDILSAELCSQIVL